MPSMHMNEHGITVRHGPHKGRLLRPTRYYGSNGGEAEWSQQYTNAVYSDDGGRSWKTSKPFPEKGTGEATLVELSDGRIYYNSRVHWDQNEHNTRRRSALSRDGGAGQALGGPRPERILIACGRSRGERFRRLDLSVLRARPVQGSALGPIQLVVVARR